MKKYYTDKKVESLQELIDFLDKAKNKKETYEDVFCFCLNGTEIDVLKLIERYGLKHDTKSDSIDGTYGQFTAFPQFQKNTYCVGPKSQYGHIPYSLNIKGYGVFVKKNSRTKYETYSSTTVNKLKRTDNYVVVDIETTGLNPIFDDIIQICVYENKNKYTLRYLPLERKRQIQLMVNIIQLVMKC